MKTECLMMVGPDAGMDRFGDGWGQLTNPLPINCPHCTFPDLDFVAAPYLLAKGFDAPTEITSAVVGNFLVRDRVRQILEISVPGACSFHPTADRKGKKESRWWLAVPKALIDTPAIEAKKVCSKCGQPKKRFGPMKDVWEAMQGFKTDGIDIFKSKPWHCQNTAEEQIAEYNYYRKKDGIPLMEWKEMGITPPPHPERWTRLNIWRDLYFSVRLEQLLKRAKVKAQLVRSSDFKAKPTPEDEKWIAEKLAALSAAGLIDAPQKAGAGDESRKWFEAWLKKNKKKSKPIDFSAIEKKQKIKLPDDYKKFIEQVGSKTFRNVMEMSGCGIL